MASIQSHYEINVSVNGQHFFATADRSITSESKATALVKLFRVKFPEEEGYQVTCSYIQCGSRNVNI